MKTVGESLQELADAEYSALVTIETAERLVARAVGILDTLDLSTLDSDEIEKFDQARNLLLAATGETTTRTASAVKNQVVSDAIAQRASARVREVVSGI